MFIIRPRPARSSCAAQLFAGAAVLALSAGVVRAEAPDDTVDEVIVTGSIVGSQMAALQQQRAADNLVNIVAADNIGQFPDQNSAAALARVPAVAVQRDQGQERYLQVRGAPNRWTSVSIDGITVIGVDEAGGQRAFRFDAVPAVILSALEVNKSLTPDLSAESVVARVNLRTLSPFDRPGFSASADLGLGEMDLGGGKQEQYSARVSWSDERWGFAAAASHYLREQTTDNREFDYDAAGVASAIDVRNYLVERENNALMGTIEFRPADGHSVFAKSLYTEFNDDEQRNQYVFQIGSAASGVRGASRGDLVGVPVRGSFNYGKYRNWNLINTIGGDHQIGGWTTSWRVNQTETENTTDLPLVLQQYSSSSVALRPSLSYDLSDPNLPVITLFGTVPGATAGSFARGAPLAALNQGNFNQNLVLPLTSAVTSESWIYKADATRALQWNGQEVEVSFGAQYDDRQIDGAILSGVAPPVAIFALFPTVGLSFNPGAYVTDRPWDSGFPRGFDVNYVDNERMTADIRSGLAALQTAGRYDPSVNTAPSDRYSIEEKLLAGYGMAKFRAGPAEVVAGLRVERLDQTIQGFVTAGAVVTPLKVENDDTQLFPSLNAKFELSEDLLLRLAAQRAISRPSFGTVRTGASVSDVNEVVSGGNPLLEPEKTWGLDASLERYLPGAGLVSVGAFYRHVDNVLFNSTTVVGDDRYNAGGINRSGYDYTTTLNGDDGKLYGLELAYLQQFVFLPAPFDGLGVQGNLAFLDGEFQTPDGRTAPFPGTSNTIVNASVYYEKHGLSARLSYQWRDDWVDTLSLVGYGDQYRKAYESLDLSVRYALNDRFSVFVDANNLTDETYIAYEGDENHPSEVEQIGSRWMAGFRFTY
ncbi:TonB-dependent receptor [Phenylobacterium deserti]|uniref:TonB-dependent receptor n=1 Tax=Phenylobacterium deserti TaxID=1914756 RepID=A0A328AD23_9CAUL|nr:TonB-dependent receptor [Phenylobacterium deserti]RAK52662.1 TonB-dependent receptor [Phenylobacterium deserti]